MSSAQFTTTSPGIIDYSEQRIYRDLDLLSTTTSDSSGSLTALNRSYTFPSHFIIVEQVNIITPAGSLPSGGSRVGLIPVSKPTLDVLWPSAVGATTPSLFAMFTDQSIIVGPWPDSNYTVEVVGTIRPTPLSASNTTTALTLYLPDLFIAASMVYISGWMRNFGSQADDPQQAQSWENQYQTLLRSADVEETRKKCFGAGWTSRKPAPLAQAPG